MKVDDALEDFVAREITLNGMTKNVYVAGSGPAVIIMTEMPGISPHVARFARWVRDAGFKVYMPSLFGRDGAVPEADEGAEVLRRACMSAEFRALKGGASSPVTQWLRALARHAHQECGGPGVGAIGMCFTGNFALTMMLEPAMLAPVLAQPSLPLKEPAGLEIAPEEIVAVRARLERENLTVLAYRFEGDQICRAERFAAYASALGDRFVARELLDSAANPDVAPFFAHRVPFPHSVVTQHLIDEAGQPTIAARDEILKFFTMRLTGAGMADAVRPKRMNSGSRSFTASADGTSVCRRRSSKL
jgi:dienelactone hydrolase